MPANSRWDLIRRLRVKVDYYRGDKGKSSRETSVHIYQTTRRHIPENTNLYSDSRAIEKKPLRLFLFPPFYLFFFVFFFLLFISHVFFLLVRILPCLLYYLFISFFLCILVSSFHFSLFSPFHFCLHACYVCYLLTHTYCPLC